MAFRLIGPNWSTFGVAIDILFLTFYCALKEPRSTIEMVN
jgi:hypothetical protein